MRLGHPINHGPVPSVEIGMYRQVRGIDVVPDPPFPNDITDTVDLSHYVGLHYTVSPILRGVSPGDTRGFVGWKGSRSYFIEITSMP